MTAEENQIISLLQEKSEAGLTLLSNRYGRLLFSLAKNILKDSRDAEECVNDTYMEAYHALAEKQPDSLTAYLCTIAKHNALDRLKMRNRKKRADTNTVSFEEIEEIVPCLEPRESEQLRELLDEFLQGQSPESRMLFVRRYWYYDSFHDLSKLLKVSETAVRMRLSRVKKQLKRFLTEKGVEL